MGFRCAKTRNWGTLCEAPALYRHGYRDRYTLHVSRNTGAQETGGEAVPNENLAANRWAETSVGIADLASSSQHRLHKLLALLGNKTVEGGGHHLLAEARYEYQKVKHKALAVLLLYRLYVQPAGMEVKVGGFAGCVCTCTRTLQVPRRCTRGRPMQAHVQSTRCMCSICTESLVHLTYMHVRNRDLISLPHDSCSSKSSGSRNRYVPRPGPRLRIHGRFSGRVVGGASLRTHQSPKMLTFGIPWMEFFRGGCGCGCSVLFYRDTSLGGQTKRNSAQPRPFFFVQSFLCSQRSILT